eukprot:6721049-Alexandrium_andersonii.AAC.1
MAAVSAAKQAVLQSTCRNPRYPAWFSEHTRRRLLCSAMVNKQAIRAARAVRGALMRVVWHASKHAFHVYDRASQAYRAACFNDAKASSLNRLARKGSRTCIEAD